MAVITTNFSALTAGRDVTKLAGREVIVVGDGHCLLHAFAMSLEDEKITISSIEDLCSKLKNEIEQHLSFYRPFSTNESLIEDTDSYVKSNQYNMNTADLVLYALCNALMVTAVIYEVRGSSVITLSHEPGQPEIESTGKIFFTLHGSGVGSHYNAVVEKSSQQPLTNVVTEEIFSPEAVMPHPKAPPRKQNLRGRKRRHTAILTDSPERDAIYEEEKKREERKQKKLIVCHKNPKR